jgi:hypothetical protein
VIGKKENTESNTYDEVTPATVQTTDGGNSFHFENWCIFTLSKHLIQLFLLKRKRFVKVYLAFSLHYTRPTSSASFLPLVTEVQVFSRAYWLA